MKRNARANQEVIRHLTAILADEDVRKNFPSYLPFIQRIINSQVNSRTNVSPTQMIFGNAINHDSQFLSAPTTNDLDKSALEYMSNMLQIQQKIILIAQKSQEENDTHYIATQENSHKIIYMTAQILSHYDARYLFVHKYICACFFYYFRQKLSLPRWFTSQNCIPFNQLYSELSSSPEGLRSNISKEIRARVGYNKVGSDRT